MNKDPDPLCCCEYFDVHQQRNHILACCCNCVDLDASCDSLVRCSSVPLFRVHSLMGTLRDRLRIPWLGGARKVSCDVLLPVVILPTAMLLASIDVWWTAFLFIPAILFVIYLSFKRGLTYTQFFYSWCIVSLLLLFLIFEFIVVPLLEILISENCGVTLLGSISVCAFYFAKLSCKESEKITENSQVCAACNISIPGKHFHCVWLDCCIGFRNRFPFLVGIIFAIATLSYSSNLTLTSVCHPRRWIYTILIPDDCTGVYDETLQISLSFVSGVYSIIICNLLLVYIVYEIGLALTRWCMATNNTTINQGILTDVCKQV